MDETPTALPVQRSRWSSAAWITACLLMIVLVVGIWMRVGGQRAGANLTNSIISGDRPVAPALPTTEIPRDGAPGLPDWYRAGPEGQRPNANGQVLVVNWWASWCGPCKQEAPVLRRISEEYRGKVTVVGLNAGSKDLESDARAFVRSAGFRFTIVRGDRTDEDAWGINGFPETFIVGTDGRISAFVNGPIDEETLRGLLDRELQERRT